MNPTINETSAPIMPRVEELPYHGANPTGVRRFLLEGGDLAPEHAAQPRRDDGLGGGGDWCEVTVSPDGALSYGGGSVWPTAWPDLFTPFEVVGPGGLRSGGFRLTSLGFKLLGMHVTVNPTRPSPPTRPTWIVRLDGRVFGYVRAFPTGLFEVNTAHESAFFPTLEAATKAIIAHVEETENAQQFAELTAPTDGTRAALYADLAKLAARDGRHDLAADMYKLAAEHAVGRDAIDGYLQAANVERTAARSTAAVQS